MDLNDNHERLKKIRGRGDATQSHLASVRYLQQLENELDQIRKHLNEAWIGLEATRDFRKCSRHADHAQQRLHKVIKKMARRGGKK